MTLFCLALATLLVALLAPAGLILGRENELEDLMAAFGRRVQEEYP